MDKTSQKVHSPVYGNISDLQISFSEMIIKFSNIYNLNFTSGHFRTKWPYD